MKKLQYILIRAAAGSLIGMAVQDQNIIAAAVGVFIIQFVTRLQTIEELKSC